VEKFRNELLRLVLCLDFIVACYAGIELLTTVHVNRSFAVTRHGQGEIYWRLRLARRLDHLPLHENRCSAAVTVPLNVVSNTKPPAANALVFISERFGLNCKESILISTARFHGYFRPLAYGLARAQTKNHPGRSATRFTSASVELGSMLLPLEPSEHATSDLERRILAGIPIAVICGIVMYVSFLHRMMVTASVSDGVIWTLSPVMPIRRRRLSAFLSAPVGSAGRGNAAIRTAARAALAFF
jgi:hypothetical protein